jgi:aryl-alcohol dehydrogenase
MHATAAVMRDQQGPFSIEDIDIAGPGPGEILVRTVGVGFCHTDLLFRHVPNPPLPIILGHEGAGVVEEVGPRVSEIAVGDHVVLSYDSCGQCRNCRTANSAYCAEFALRNFVGARPDGSVGAVDARGESVRSRWFGQSSFANYVVATERNAVVVDPSLDLEVLGPLGCGIQTGAGSVLNALRVRPGSSIAVFGVGAVGMAAVMASAIAGAQKIIAIDRHQKRLEQALSLGATHVLNAGSAADLAHEVKLLTGGGSDYAFDTTGVPSVIVSAIDGLRMTGVCGLVGAGMGELGLSTSALSGKTIMGIYEGSAVPQVFIPQMIEFWRSGRFPFDRLIRTYPLERIGDAEHDSVSGEVIKPVLLPTT